MTAYETALQDAEALRRDEHGNFRGTRPSPSQRRQHRLDLMREVEVRWLIPEDQARALPWARERFGRPLRRQSGLIAKSVDGAGRAIRYWIARPEDLAVYARMLKAGDATCPIEAIAPWTIQPGEPAAPAHAFLLPLMWQAIAADEGSPVELPQLEPDHGAKSKTLVEIDRAFYRGLRPEKEVASHG